MTYIAMRNVLVSCLENDSAAQEAGRYEEIGAHFDSVADFFDALSHVGARHPRIGSAEHRNGVLGNGWIGARYNRWQNSYVIGEADWPRLARCLAVDLAADREAWSRRSNLASTFRSTVMGKARTTEPRRS